MNSYLPSTSGAATIACWPNRAVAFAGCDAVSLARSARTVNGSPWGTTSFSGSGTTAAKVYRGVDRQGAASRARAFEAAAGT